MENNCPGRILQHQVDTQGVLDLRKKEHDEAALEAARIAAEEDAETRQRIADHEALRSVRLDDDMKRSILVSRNPGALQDSQAARQQHSHYLGDLNPEFKREGG